jgi:hypothetical protein
MSTQLGTQWALFYPVSTGSISRVTQENVMAKPLSGAPFPILKPAECLRFSCRFYGVKPCDTCHPFVQYIQFVTITISLAYTSSLPATYLVNDIAWALHGT